MKSPPYLPFELVTQIHLRLPVKSLIRFKCVSKSWFSHISHSNFANSHFQLSQPTHRILSISSTLPAKIRYIDFELSLNHESTSLNHTSLPMSSYDLEIKGSCRGFLFLRHHSKFYLWNPSTGFHIQIPASNVKAYKYSLYGFGYDRSRDDYLLVLFSSSRLEFFSLRDNTWTKIEGPHIRCCSPYSNPKPGTLYNGAIHWLVYRHNIVVFDLMGRKLLDMPLPHDLFHPLVNCALLVFKEFLSICAMNYNPGYYKSKFEMWVMKDYKLHSSWTKIRDLFIDYPTPNFYPICFTKSGDILGTYGADGLIKYNDKGQRLEYRNYAHNPVGFKVAVYTESLLSLPSNFEQVEEDDTNKKNEVLKCSQFSRY